MKCTSAFVAPIDQVPTSLVATGSRGIKFVADVALDPAVHGAVGAQHVLAWSLTEVSTQENFDLLVIPGGAKGAETLSRSPTVQLLIKEYVNANKYVGMICAG